jgi:hypothetical protein
MTASTMETMMNAYVIPSSFFCPWKELKYLHRKDNAKK